MDTIARPATRPLTLQNAHLVLPEGTASRGSVTLLSGVIEALEPEFSAGDAHDCAGDFLMPGIVDVHTDHFEKHILPRPHVAWDPLRAALAYDAQVIGAGTTTVFDSLSVGSAEDDARRRELFLPMVDAIRRGRANGLFKAEHLIHLRCEVCDEATPALLEAVIDGEAIAAASVMDHTPGVRQTRDIEHFITRRAVTSGRPVHMERQVVREQQIAAAGVVDRVRPKVVQRLMRTDLPIMSHDDTTEAQVEEAHADGFSIAEFPTSLAAAARARALGMTIVAGAPNYLLGGSQSGNVAVADLLARGLVDILASDYVPRSILDAVFALSADDAFGLSLADAVNMATVAPARACGLTDRGAIAPQQRADLIQISLVEGQPVVRAAWREGWRVA